MNDAVVAAINRHIQTLETLPMGEFERGVVHGLRVALIFNSSATKKIDVEQPIADVISFQEETQRRRQKQQSRSTQQA